MLTTQRWFYWTGSYQLDVELSNHLHLEVDDVSVPGVSEKMETKKISLRVDTTTLWCESVVRTRPEVLQGFMDHVLDEVDLKWSERSRTSLTHHLSNVLGQSGGDGRGQNRSWGRRTNKSGTRIIKLKSEQLPLEVRLRYNSSINHRLQ